MDNVPDHATADFLRSFSEEVQKKGEAIHQEGCITQIYGNHLSIRGLIEIDEGNFQTQLNLSGNKWIGKCSAPEPFLREICLYATMFERMVRGVNLPESPVSLNEVPLIDKVEDVLGREVNEEEGDYISKIEKRYQRYLTEGEIYDYDLIRLDPRWEIESYEKPLNLWPKAPESALEFWNYIAYAFYKKKIKYPNFLDKVTDLGQVQDQLFSWEKSNEIKEWQAKIAKVIDRPLKEGIKEMEFRLMANINYAYLQVREKAGEWQMITEIAQIEIIADLHKKVALKSSSASTILLENYLAYFRTEGKIKLDFEEIEACQLMNRFFNQPELTYHLINIDGCYFKMVKGALHWVCEEDPYRSDVFALQLKTAENISVSHSVRHLAGQQELYQSDETVFPGPPNWHEKTEVMPRHLVDKKIIASLEGIEFLRKIGATLPPELEKLVEDVWLNLHFDLILQKGLDNKDSEYLVVKVFARDEQNIRHEVLQKDHWKIQKRESPQKDTMYRFIRDKLNCVSDFLQEINLNYDQKIEAFKVKINQNFPEKFIHWLKNTLDGKAVYQVDEKLKTLLNNPIEANVRFELVAQDIDWFDLKVVLDVEGLSLSKNEIKALVVARGGYVRIEDGGWLHLKIQLEGERLELIENLGIDLYEFSEKPHRMHAVQFAKTEGLGDLFEKSAWQQVLERLNTIQLDVKANIPKGLKATLRPYQEEGFRFLTYLATNNFGGILADDMGLGKTVQTLTYLLWLKNEKKKENEPMLVVCPKSVVSIWTDESKRFIPEIKVLVISSKKQLIEENIYSHDLIVLNYVQLRLNSEFIKNIKWLCVVLDEGQQIKNPESKVAAVAFELNSRYRLILSGTPIENRLLDVWSLMAFSMPGLLGTKAYFKKQFNAQKDRGIAQECLGARLKPFLLRRTKKQVASDLPPRIEEELSIPLEGVQEQLYQFELKKIQQTLLKLKSNSEGQKNSFAVLQGLLKLRQICCHPGLVDPKYLKEESSKLNALYELLEQLYSQGHKVLVFSQFVSVLDMIKAYLTTLNRPICYLTGQTKDRKEEIDRFQVSKKAETFLLSLKAGGAGLNLTSASYVILYDPWWNPAVENQAIDRTHRIGQKNKVIAYRLIAENTIESKIRLLQEQKKSLIKNVISDDAFAKKLGMDDLKAILDLDESKLVDVPSEE